MRPDAQLRRFTRFSESKPDPQAQLYLSARRKGMPVDRLKALFRPRLEGEHLVFADRSRLKI